jgi:hypothetical protein
MAPIRFKLAWNTDAALVGIVGDLNLKWGHRAIVDEVFGSLPDSGFPSARPSSRLAAVPWKVFAAQVCEYAAMGVGFNYLVNTGQKLDGEGKRKLLKYVETLQAVGVRKLTVGLPQTVRAIKQSFPELKVVMSLSWDVRTVEQVREAEDAGVDSMYLSGPSVNRDFPLLRKLVQAATVPCGLYANVSCLSRCPVLHDHYALFAGDHGEAMITQNDAYFSSCSRVKMKDPVEWIQMPWIRPEDTGAYVDEGISFFKLADRLAPTETLRHTCESYLSGQSPVDLFPLIEGDGRKYKQILGADSSRPFRVDRSEIPPDFLKHFRYGTCRSTNPDCIYCREVALRSVGLSGELSDSFHGVPTEMPAALVNRAKDSR